MNTAHCIPKGIVYGLIGLGSFLGGMAQATPMDCQQDWEILNLVPRWKIGERAKHPAPPEATTADALKPEVHGFYKTQLADHLTGLEAMRNEFGLLTDVVSISPRLDDDVDVIGMYPAAAPTDMALDLIVHTALAAQPERYPHGMARLERVFNAIAVLDREPQTGLFFRKYEPQAGQLPRVDDKDLSSVDNVHLALALWTVAERFPHTSVGRSAAKIFANMNFSRFYDAKRRLVGGNIKHVVLPSGKSEWRLEPHRYDFGTEARSVYLLTHALQLFRDHTALASENALLRVPAEILRNKKQDYLRVWDGGIFQALLPVLLTGEDRYSKHLSANANSISDLQLQSGRMLQHSDGGSFFFPAGGSAAVKDTRQNEDGSWTAIYSGKVGLPLIKNSANKDVVVDDVVAMHAVLLGATRDPEKYYPALSRAATHRGMGPALYYRNIGWLDSFQTLPVEEFNAENRFSIRPNPVLVALDKGIETLSLLQILDPQRKTESAKALSTNAGASQRLFDAYRWIEQRWPK